MSEHTPGSWIVDGTTLRPYSKLRVYDQDGFMVADCDGQHLDNVAEANARLIAATPLLLEACKAFVAAYEKSLQLEKTDMAVRMARIAIEAAEGES